MRRRIETQGGNPTRETLVQVAQQQYKAIGIAIDPVLHSFPKLVERLTTGLDSSLKGVIIGFSFNADPDPWEIWHSTSQGAKGLNFVGFADARADAALERNRYGTDCSRAARTVAIHDLDVILNDEAPYTFLYVGQTVIFATQKLVAPPRQTFGGPDRYPHLVDSALGAG